MQVERPASPAPEMPMAAMIALVVACYGYPAGGVYAMPWREFVLLWSEVPRVRAYETLISAQGAALGAALAVGGKDSGALPALQRLEREVSGG